MLTLAQSRRASPFTIFRDFVLSDGHAEFTNIFYVLPDSPRLSLNADGGPAFDFVWYRSNRSGDPRAGGIAMVTVELTPPPDQRSVAAQAIADTYGVSTQSVEIRSVPFKSGSVQLTYAGETGSGEFASQVSGNGAAQLTGAEHATFAVDLTADGAALLWNAIDQHLHVFHLRYDLVFEHRLASVHMHVWCDVSSSLKAAGAWAQAGGVDPSALRSTLVTNKAAGIDITSEQPLPAEQQAALQKSGEEILNHALASTLFEPADAKAAPKVLPYSPAMEAALNFTLDESFPLQQHAVLDTLLDISLTPEQWTRQVRQCDLTDGFFSILDVQVVCTVDFSTDLISLVKVKIDYDQTGDTGRVQRSGEFVFKKNADAIQHFRSELAAPGKTSYNYTVDIFYSGDHAPWNIECKNVGKSVLVLDFDSAGVLDIVLELRNVQFEIVGAVVVDLAYPAKNLSSQLILDGKNMSGRWQAVLAEARQAWRYHVTWVLLDGRRLEGPWVDTTDVRVYLDSPLELRSRMRVQVVAAGDFSDIAQLIVDLRRQSDSSQQAQISLNAAGQTQLWESGGASASSMAYEYRRTVIYKDGRSSVLDSDWVSSTRPVLVVANDPQFHVQIVPRFLDLGASLRMVILELESEPVAPDSAERKTLLIRSKTDDLQWTFGAGSANRHNYRYRLTLVPAQGDRQPPTEWRESDAEILVLQTPHA
jgi:hypothetical protein